MQLTWGDYLETRFKIGGGAELVANFFLNTGFPRLVVDGEGSVNLRKLSLGSEEKEREQKNSLRKFHLEAFSGYATGAHPRRHQIKESVRET